MMIWLVLGLSFALQSPKCVGFTYNQYLVCNHLINLGKNKVVTYHYTYFWTNLKLDFSVRYEYHPLLELRPNSQKHFFFFLLTEPAMRKILIRVRSPCVWSSSFWYVFLWDHYVSLLIFLYFHSYSTYFLFFFLILPFYIDLF